MKKRTTTLILLVALIVPVWLNNTSLLALPPAGQLAVLAHRGLAQDYDRNGLDADTCTAARMLPPRHPFLENTVASMDAAFAMGADIVELDVHPTTDGKFAVFHDWTLDCRTEGRGRTRDHALADLKKLDVGHGYTADGGKTFPFRGKGIGLIPSLDEILLHFPDKEFHINVKSNDPDEGRRLAAYLATLSPPQRDRLAVIGGERPVAEVQKALPKMRTVTKQRLASCITRYAALAWTGYVPDDCRGTDILLPLNIAGWMWGWPNRFLDRMGSVGTRVFLRGDYQGGFSDGLDDPDAIDGLPPDYRGGISTDALDLVMPRLQGRR
jgi:glycerophosphoryl diester phosphodiesterase